MIAIANIQRGTLAAVFFALLFSASSIANAQNCCDGIEIQMNPLGGPDCCFEVILVNNSFCAFDEVRLHTPLPGPMTLSATSSANSSVFASFTTTSGSYVNSSPYASGTTVLGRICFAPVPGAHTTFVEIFDGGNFVCDYKLDFDCP